MVVNEAIEILNAPRPNYTKRNYHGVIFYKWKSSTGDMLVSFTPKQVLPNEYPIIGASLEYRKMLSTDNKGLIYYYEVRFGKKELNTEIEGYELTKTGNPTEILIGVLGATERFQKEHRDFNYLQYIAIGRGRVKAYNLLTKLMAKKNNLPYYIDGENENYANYFVFFTDKTHTKPYITDTRSTF